MCVGKGGKNESMDGWMKRSILISNHTMAQKVARESRKKVRYKMLSVLLIRKAENFCMDI